MSSCFVTRRAGRSVICRVALLALLLNLAAAAFSATSSIETLELRDQFGQSDSLAAHRGDVVVTVVVDVRRLATIERWERELARIYPAVRFLSVADMPATGPVDIERTAATLRKRVPREVPVLIDVERRWATAFDLDTAAPNLLVFDRDGTLTATFRGRWSPELGARAAAAIAPLLPAPAPVPAR